MRDTNVAAKNGAARSTISCSVRRRACASSVSRETFGTAKPAMAASRSTASENDSPSVSITKPKMSPCLPDEKSWKKPFWSFTVKDGVRSLLKGESPFHSRPAFLSFTRRPTTSETGSLARSSSRNWGGKRILYRIAHVLTHRRDGLCAAWRQFQWHFQPIL